MEQTKTELEKLESIKTAFKLREDWGGKRQGNPLEQIEKMENGIERLLLDVETLEFEIEKLEAQLAARKLVWKKKRLELKKCWLEWRARSGTATENDGQGNP